MMKISEFIKLKEGTKIYFKGMKFEIPWDVLSLNTRDIPLCTKNQFGAFKISYGHIHWEGRKSIITRYQTRIGSIKDITLYQGVGKCQKKRRL